MPGTTSEPSVALSFANNFWGKEDAGVGPMLQRMHDAKTTMEELKAFYTARAALEDEFARKLLGLSKKPLGSRESGSLKAALDILRLEVESMAKAHQQVANQMKTECEEPLAAFSGAMRERRKLVQMGIEKLLKLKMQQTGVVNKTRDRFEQDCLKIKGYLAQGHMVMGQEEKKNKARLEKAQVALTSSNAEYENAIKALEDTTTRWNRDWKAACDKFQDLEEERIDFIKSSCWTFANVSSTVCVSDDASCEKIRVSLEDCEVEKDITTFIMEKGTGRDIPDAPKYINFCRGDVVDDSASEADDNYQTAQFPRQSNPAFRSSSPNPSVMSSQASDSQSEASSAMPDPEPSRTARNSRERPIRRDTAESPTSNRTTPRRETFPQESENTPGRRGRSQTVTNNSPPGRPESSHNGSDSADPNVGFGEMVQHQQVAPLQNDDPQTKRKSGFFSNGGPFRRKSKKDLKENASPTAPQAQALQQQQHQQQQVQSRPTPASRNTWGPSNNRGQVAVGQQPPQGNQVYGSSGGRHNPSQSRLMLGGERHQSPEPIDPQSSLALNIGNNILNVSPGNDQQPPQQQQQPEAPTDDPIAAALAELKSVTKGGTIGRSTADRFFGLATPAPAASTPKPGPQQSNSMGARHTAPAGYNNTPKTSALGLPPPAFTSAEMQQTTQRYVNQRESLLDNAPPQMPAARQENNSRNSMRQRSKTMDYQPAPQQRPQSQHYSQEMVPHGQQNSGHASPVPNRSVSPRPQLYGDAAYRQASPRPDSYNGGVPLNQGNRAVSPNPYTQSRPGTAASQRGQYAAYSGTPTGQDVALYQPSSPAPSHHSRNDSYNARSRSRGPPGGYESGGSNRNSYVDPGHQGAMQMYQQGGQGGRPRSKSQGPPGGGQFARDGRPVLQYARAMYHYQAAIPEELGFSKGDILAVVRQQDDGWWEAEIVGGPGGRPGLVPSNYLQPC